MMAKAFHRGAFNTASLFILVLLIRASLIGSAPHADEGHYAAASYFQYLGYTTGLFTNGTVIPAFGGLELYSLMVSWVYAIPMEPYFLLRCIDGLFAACAGVMIYKYLCLVIDPKLPAYIATVLVIVATNHPDFIEAGARNPVPIATLSLFGALYLLELGRGKNLLWPACCLAAAVLFREYFLVLAGVVVLHAWQQHGFRTAAKLCGIAAVFGTLVILLVLALKGGIDAMGAMYDAYAAYTNPNFNLTLYERFERAIGQGSRIFHLLPFCMPVLLLGVCAPLFEPLLRTRKAISYYVLGLGLTLAPLAEILLKKPYPYHLAQMFLGASIFACYGFYTILLIARKSREYRPTASRLLVGVVLLGHVYWAQDYARTMRYAVGWSIHFAPVMVFGDWSSPIVEEAYYLQIASIVRQYSKPGDTVLSTSYNVYPLTGRVPLSRQSASLAVYQGLARGRNVDEEVVSLVRERRPMVFVEEKSVSRPKAGEQNVIGEKVAEYYQETIYVGPGLAPYRQFAATVLVVPTLR